MLAGQNTVVPALKETIAYFKELAQLTSKGIDVGLAKNMQQMKKQFQADSPFIQAMKVGVTEGTPKPKIPTFKEQVSDATKGIGDIGAIQKAGQQMGMLREQGYDVNKELAKMQNLVKGNTQQMKMLNQAMEEGRKKAKELRTRFDMNNLSLLFGGMMLQRFGQGIMKFMIPSMDKLNQLNTKGAKQVMAMGAAFEFVKISIFETLSQTPLFQKFVEWIVKAAIWVAEFAQKHPAIVAIAAAIGALAVTLGTLSIAASFIGQVSSVITIFKDWIGTLIGGGKGESVVGALDEVDKKATSLRSGWDKLGIGMGALVATIGVANMVADIKQEDFGGAIGNAIGAALGIGGAGAILMGFGPAGWTLTIAGAIVLGVTSVTADERSLNDAMNKALGNPKEGALKSWFSGVTYQMAKLFGGGQEGSRASQIIDAMDEKKARAMTSLLEDYQSTQQMLVAQEEAYASTSKSDYNTRMNLQKSINKLKEELKEDTKLMYSIDADNAPLLIANLDSQLLIMKDQYNVMNEKITKEKEYRAEVDKTTESLKKQNLVAGSSGSTYEGWTKTSTGLYKKGGMLASEKYVSSLTSGDSGG